MLERLKEAIKYFNGDLREPQVTEIHAKPLLAFAALALEAKRWPEKGHCNTHKIMNWECSYCQANEVRNDTIAACLAIHIAEIAEKDSKIADLGAKLAGLEGKHVNKGDMLNEKY